MRAVAILNALLGSWGRKGGFYIPNAMELPKYPRTGLRARGARRPPTSARATIRSPTSRWRTACATRRSRGCEAYPASGVDGLRHEPHSILPEPKKTYEGDPSARLLVAVDVFPPRSPGGADVVLPEATYLERCDDRSRRPTGSRTSQCASRWSRRCTRRSRVGGSRESSACASGSSSSRGKDAEEYAEARLKRLGQDSAS